MKIEKIYRNKEYLKKEYSIKKESIPKIARKLGCAQTTVYYWMKKLRISRRSHLEAVNNHVDLSIELVETLNGLMLGDGHLSVAKWSSGYVQGSKFRDFLVWLSKVLAHHGIGQIGRIRRREEDTHFPGGKIQHTIAFHYNSRWYVELKAVHSKWYRPATQKEKEAGRKFFKIIPPDLKLTPLTCLHWYIGDGYLGLNGKRNRHIDLCTQSFTTAEICLLISSLKSLGFKATAPKCKSIRISTKSTEDFFDYIGQCPEEIEGVYGYKWRSYGT